MVTLGGGDVASIAHLGPEVAAAFGINLSTDTITRREAMTVPSVRRARNLIAGTIGTLPLVGVRTLPSGDEQVVDRPLLRQPDPNTTPQFVLTWTIDDLLFHGVAWWQVMARDFSGFPIAARRIPRERLNVNIADGVIRVDGRIVPNADMIRFDGPDEGILRTSARELWTCVVLSQAARRFAKTPMPTGIFTPVEGAPELTPAKVAEILAEWEAARERGSTGYVNRALNWREVTFDPDKLQLTESRAFMAAEVARIFNLPPRYVNAPSGDSLTYSTVEADRRELLDLSLAPYVTAIDQRLSLDDLTPRGQLVRIDTLKLLRGDTKTALETAEIADRLGVAGKREIRNDFLGRPGEIPADATPSPSPSPTPGGTA